MSALDLQETIDAFKGVLAAGPMPVTPDLGKDFTTALNFVPYNLVPGAKLLAPVITPIRNVVPRTQGKGKATEFRAVTSYNATAVSSWAAEGTTGSTVSTTAVDVTMPYKIQSLANNVTFEAQYQGAGFTDAKALAVANLLRAFLIQEEQNFLFGNPSTALTAASAGGQAVSIGGAVGASAAPTNVATNSGGTVGAGTYNCRQTALVGPGMESLPNASPVNSAPSGGTSILTLTPTAVAGAISYNLYYKLSTDTTYNVVSTNGAPVVVSSYTAGSATLPGSDLSGSSLAFPGILQQILAAGSGATILRANGALSFDTSSTLGNMHTFLQQMWDQGRADPDWIVCNSFESRTITRGTWGAGSPYFVQPDGTQQAGVGGFRVSRFTNEITGTLMDVKVHPYLPQGTLLALSMKMPAWYPGSDIPNVWTFEAVYDYLELDYPPTSPKWPIEVRNNGALLLWLPIIQGAILGITTA